MKKGGEMAEGELGCRNSRANGRGRKPLAESVRQV